MKQEIKMWILTIAVLVHYWGVAQSEKVPVNDNPKVHQEQEGRMQLGDSLATEPGSGPLEMVQPEEKIDRGTDSGTQPAKLYASMDSLQKRQLRIQEEVDSLRSGSIGVPVIIFNDTVFRIYSKLGPFSPSDRAQNIANKVEMMVDESLFDAARLVVKESGESHDVAHGDIVLFSITDTDAFWLKGDRGVLAEKYRAAIEQSIENYRGRTGLWVTLKRIGLLMLVLALFFFGITYMNRGFKWLHTWLSKKGSGFIKGVKFRNYEFLSRQRQEQLIDWLWHILKWFCIVLVVYLVLPVIFSIFPATTGMAIKLFGYLLNPLKSFGSALIGYIPELITIVVIVIITRYFIRFLKFLASEVESGKLNLPGFYPDWAVSTFNLLKIIIYAFAFIIIFPYLPGSDSPIFQGVSVFLGLLISLGSSSAIGNIIAGLVITYMRAFKIGDRVKIGDTTGDVTEKTMLVTRLRTIKNEDITIPNSAILNGSTINYSSSAQSLGLILNSTVTIGYDIPWRTVQELLINAALKTEHIKKDPLPFVLQTSLDDFYVSYQVNAYTEQARAAAKIYSQLHANIQDVFNEAGVEILSPHYRAARDGNMTTIPPEHLAADYRPPTFNIRMDKNQEK